jgi:hypothetical protein
MYGCNDFRYITTNAQYRKLISPLSPGSVNGTYVDGKQIPKGQRVLLLDGATISLVFSKLEEDAGNANPYNMHHIHTFTNVKFQHVLHSHLQTSFQRYHKQPYHCWKASMAMKITTWFPRDCSNYKQPQPRQ